MGKKLMTFAGITTLLQAVIQVIFSSVSLAQYFCLIDFLQELPLFIYIRILYYHNPGQCGTRINIGQAIDGIANQAFILMTSEPLTVTRTFIINCASLGLGVLWLITSAILMTGGIKDDYSKPIRWPWIMVSVATCGVDVVATVIFANDSFYTRTLVDLVDYVGGTASGTGNAQINTSLAAWLMVILYSRFTVIFLLNLLLIVLVALHKPKAFKNDAIAIETPAAPITPVPPALTMPISTHDAQVQSSPVLSVQGRERVEANSISEQNVTEVLQQTPRYNAAALSNITEASSYLSSTRDPEDSLTRDSEVSKIPRAGFSQAFRRMKQKLFARNSPPPRRTSVTNSLDESLEKSPRMPHEDIDKKRTVNFPDNLLSLPQRLENMIAEQQRRLDSAVIDTAGRSSPPRATQSLPQLNDTNEGPVPVFNRGRRGTAAELQGQLPWAYIPASAHRMRDQLPPDEDLPPVPLPDYTAIAPYRKASVHRAASSLSSLTQKRNYFFGQNNKSALRQTDVLY